MKKLDAMDIVARHTLNSLPDSVVERRHVLNAVLAACPHTEHADKISLMLEHLQQHEAMLPSRQRPPARGPLGPVCEAIDDCLAKPLHDPVRVVLVLIESKDQESDIARQLAARYSALEIKSGAELPATGHQVPPLLVIQNTEKLARHDLTACRYLINRARVVLALLVFPETWRKWNTRWPMESAPLRRRVLATFQPNSQTKSL